MLRKHTTCQAFAMSGLLVLCGCAGRATVSHPTPTPSPSIINSPVVVDGCTSTPVQVAPAPWGPVPRIPWIQAGPGASGIIGHLFFYSPADPYLHTGGKMPDGSTTKILWVASASLGMIGNQLEVTGTRLPNKDETFRQVFPVANGNEFPSIVNVPSAGCWQLALITGSISGTVTLWVRP